MSGIVGILHLDGRPVDGGLLGRMTQLMAYRGPDDQQLWTDGNVGLGHTMLRTTDEAARERQPCTLDGAVWITADARVDGRAELVDRLRGRGARGDLRAATDPELILHAYAAWGEGCLEHLLGDYAFAIWDGRRRRLFCARDPFGVKLFYYARVGGAFVFGNTLDCVRQHPAVSADLNELAVADFLLAGFNWDLASTTFADVQRLPPGHMLLLDEGQSRPDVRRHWSFPAPAPVRYRREADYVEHFVEHLRAAVSDRLRTTRLGLYMSGGLDSTTLAAVAHDVLARSGRPFALAGFTRTCDWLIPDEEGRYAALAAEALGIPLRTLTLEEHAPFDYLADPALRSPEPNDNPDVAVWLGLSRAVAGHARVALYGEDGDALLQPTTLANQVRERGALDTAVGVLRHVRRQRRLPYTGLGLRQRLGRRRAPAPAPAACPAWLDPDFAKRHALAERYRDQQAPAPVGASCTRPEMRRQLSAPIWQSFLETLDAGVTRLPLEIRLPLLDVRLLAYVLAIPALPWGERKELLRRAAAPMLPEAVVHRPKTPLRQYAEARWRQLAATGLPAATATLDLVTEYVAPLMVPSASDPAADWSDLRPRLLNHWLAQAGAAAGSTPFTFQGVAS